MANDRAEAVKQGVTIPTYFYNIIVPQMADYYSDYTVNFDIKPVAKCPLHDEETPSMRYYEETNTFFCWGCRVGGDVIQLHRKFMEKVNGQFIPFDAAVSFLYKYFIEGRETAKLFQTKAKREELNTTSELVRLGMYTKKLDLAIQDDKEMQLTTKKQIWQALDTIHILISLQMIRADEARQYIQQTVFELTTAPTIIQTTV